MGLVFRAECLSPERQNAARPGTGKDLVDLPEGFQADHVAAVVNQV
jgi:hypothetical protein